MKQFSKRFIFNIFLMIFGAMLAFFSIALFSTVNAEVAKQSVVGITSYKFDAIVSKDHVYDITKTIVIDVHDQLSEYTLYIPKGNYKVKDIDLKGTDFSVESAAYDYKITLKSPEDFGKGKHKLKLSYKIFAYSDKDKAGDLFYMNVLPSTFDTPIEDMQITVLFPKDFVRDDLQYFAGQFGVQDVSDKVKVKLEGNELNMTGKNIPENFNIILKANLPEDYWQGELDNSWTSKVIMGLSVIILLILILLWFTGGRDPKVSVKKGSPDCSIPPPEANYLLSGKVGINDVISMILYLGSRGYLKIIEHEPKKYRLINLDNPEREPRYIRNFFNGLFDEEYNSKRVEMNELIKRLGGLEKNLSKNVKSTYSGKEMLSVTGRSKTYRLIGIFLISIMNAGIVALNFIARYTSIDFVSAISIFAMTALATLLINMGLDNFYRPNKLLNAFIFTIGTLIMIMVTAYMSYSIYLSFKDTWTVALYAALVVADIFFICIMKARAKGNAEVVSEVLALRDMIIHSDREDILREMKESKTYFYDIAPYAYAFLMLDRWGNKFKDIDLPGAEWLEPYEHPHDVQIRDSEIKSVEFASDVASFSRTIQSEQARYSYRNNKDK